MHSVCLVRPGWEEMEDSCLVVIIIKSVNLCDLWVNSCQRWAILLLYIWKAKQVFLLIVLNNLNQNAFKNYLLFFHFFCSSSGPLARTVHSWAMIGSCLISDRLCCFTLKAPKSFMSLGWTPWMNSLHPPGGGALSLFCTHPSSWVLLGIYQIHLLWLEAQSKLYCKMLGNLTRPGYLG